MQNLELSEIKPEQMITSIVIAFYEKAVSDTLIGYHFRKIQETTETNHSKSNSLALYSNQEILKDHPLHPSLKSFSRHLPKIIFFWCRQLGIKTKFQDLSTPESLKITDQQLLEQHVFRIFETHEKLNIRLGELNRWLILFRETSDNYFEELLNSFVKNSEMQKSLELTKKIQKHLNQKIDFFEIKFKDYFFSN